jgi:hypothetical protein
MDKADTRFVDRAYGRIATGERDAEQCGAAIPQQSNPLSCPASLAGQPTSATSSPEEAVQRTYARTWRLDGLI